MDDVVKMLARGYTREQIAAWQSLNASKKAKATAAKRAAKKAAEPKPAEEVDGESLRDN